VCSAIDVIAGAGMSRQTLNGKPDASFDEAAEIIEKIGLYRDVGPL
jgi:hypothetical protein